MHLRLNAQRHSGNRCCVLGEHPSPLLSSSSLHSSSDVKSPLALFFFSLSPEIHKQRPCNLFLPKLLFHHLFWSGSCTEWKGEKYWERRQEGKKRHAWRALRYTPRHRGYRSTSAGVPCWLTTTEVHHSSSDWQPARAGFYLLTSASTSH